MQSLSIKEDTTAPGLIFQLGERVIFSGNLESNQNQPAHSWASLSLMIPCYKPVLFALTHQRSENYIIAIGNQQFLPTAIYHTNAIQVLILIKRMRGVYMCWFGSCLPRSRFLASG